MKSASHQLRAVGLKAAPVLVPRTIRVGFARETVFHPSMALARLQAENERLAQELWALEKSGLLIRPSEARAVVARRPQWRHNALTAKRDKYATDPAYRARKQAYAKARYAALKAAAHPSPLTPHTS